MKTANASREDFADELRGFALLGIVVVNAPFLGISWMGFTEASLASTLDRFAAMTTVALAQAKFYVLFAFLFGYSTSFFLAQGDQQSSKRFLRRLIGLAVLGVLHAIFFFPGDILLLYALLGTSLLWLVHKTDRTCWIVAIVSFVVWIALLLLLLIAAMLAPEEFAMRDESLNWINQALRSGTFADATLARVHTWPFAFTLISVLNGLGVLAMFTLGHLAGRRKVLAEPVRFEPLWRNGSRFGLFVGVPTAITSAWLAVGPGSSIETPGLREVGGVVLGFVSAPLLTWGYVAWLYRLRQRFADSLSWFRRTGRMSLTGYVGESVLLSLVFCGYGLGWLGQFGAFGTILIGIAGWFALDLFSHLWSKRFQFGPLEYLLRWWVKR
jgi:uncharacterized protein